MKDRDARLYKYWLEHDMSLQNIANVFHIKHRQQVHAIIKKESLLVKAEKAGVVACRESRSRQLLV